MVTPTLLVAVYGAVLAAELLGDKTLYTLGSLSSRYRAAPLALGATAAFMAKMAVAVLAGAALHRLPPWAIRAAAAATFLSMAVVLRRKRPAEPSTSAPRVAHWTRPAFAGFGAVFFSEWCDPGQLTAAAMAARHGAPLAVWAMATLAMMTKGALGMLLGTGLRKWAPRAAVRPVSVAVCIALGAAALAGVEL